ncbi:hypothetical protein BDP27DRAFT_1333501 [Rhodocollybia butyracea]|uniref:Uncharacterized protein n=1 Tax=Rhodocollybia butyracea TaxID=206335 RepID=A0A9P5U332_9AGAR|nr:hypothetical protein BDP27DRAFT_1333501 [Rhodocollybia butyracea]
MSVRVWDAESGNPVGKPLEGHTACVNSVASSRIVAGSSDTSVQIHGAEPLKPSNEHIDLILPTKPSSYSNQIHYELPLLAPGPSTHLMIQSSSAHQNLPNPSPSVVTLCSHLEHYLQYPQLPFSTFHLTNEGWLCGSHSKLLLWIPLHVQQTLLLPPLLLVISNDETFTLNIQNFVHGNDWARCHKKPTL